MVVAVEPSYIDAAVARLRGLGFTVFPVSQEKRPRVKWQSTPPPGGWTFGPNDLIGVAMPEGTVAVDIDRPEVFAETGLSVPPTKFQTTRRPGGVHHFYRTSKQAYQTQQGDNLGYDTRVGGLGLIIAWHPEDWTHPSEWAEAPEWVYNRPRRDTDTTTSADADFLPPGQRHGYYVSLAGRLKNAGLSPETIFDALKAENARRSPDHDIADLRAIADSTRDWEGEVIEELHHKRLDWPEPVDDAAYHGVLGDIVRSIAPHTEADPVGILGALLTMFGMVVGGSSYLYQGGKQYANIFVALIGETGIGRKGTASDAAAEAFSLAYPNWRDHIAPGLGSGEGLTSKLSASEDHIAFVREGEFGHILTAMTRDGSTLSETIRNAWDHAPLGRQVANRNASTIVLDHHVGILANITEVELSQKLTSEDAANGFANRFIWLAVRRSKLLPQTTPLAELAQPHAGALADAIAFAQRENRMRFSPEAQAVWNAMYHARNSILRVGMFRAVTNRADPYTGRLAMLYAMLDRTPVIDVQHLRAAMALWDYAERSALYVFGDSTGDKKADAMLAELELSDEPTEWNVLKRDLGFRYAGDMERTVDFLIRLGRVRVSKVSRAGGRGAGRGAGGRSRRLIEVVR